METPLEGNAFTKAMADNNGDYKAAKMQLEGSPTQMNGMMQPNQMPQSLINPTALGSMQSQIPNMFGQPQPGVSYNNVMPNPSAPLNQSTYGMLSAKNSKEAAVAEAKRLAAQKKAREERDKKRKKNKKKTDPVSGSKK
jgi:hypothetical protein